MAEGLPYRTGMSDERRLVYLCNFCDAEIPEGLSVEWVKDGNKHIGVRAYSAGAIAATEDHPDGQDEVLHDCSEPKNVTMTLTYPDDPHASVPDSAPRAKKASARNG